MDVVEEVVNFLLKGYSGMEEPIIQTNGLLVFDSYYFTAASRKTLQDNRKNIKYVCSVKQNNINGIWKACQQSMIENLNPEHNCIFFFLFSFYWLIIYFDMHLS